MLPNPYGERLKATQQLGQAPNSPTRARMIDAITAECRAAHPHLFSTADEQAVLTRRREKARATLVLARE